MNKKRVNEYLPAAIEGLKKCGIVTVNDKTKAEEIEKTFRGQISSFGAAVYMGSFKSAVAFFADQGGASVDRAQLLEVLWFVTNNKVKMKAAEIAKAIICESDSAVLKRRENEFLDASIAVKMAMNVYQLK